MVASTGCTAPAVVASLWKEQLGLPSKKGHAMLAGHSIALTSPATKRGLCCSYGQGLGIMTETRTIRRSTKQPLTKLFVWVYIPESRAEFFGVEQHTRSTCAFSKRHNRNYKSHTAHATLPKGGAALQNLRIPTSLPKTIDFQTFKT